LEKARKAATILKCALQPAHKPYKETKRLKLINDAKKAKEGVLRELDFL